MDNMVISNEVHRLVIFWISILIGVCRNINLLAIFYICYQCTKQYTTNSIGDQSIYVCDRYNIGGTI
jgi:hypothetical protein